MARPIAKVPLQPYKASLPESLAVFSDEFGSSIPVEDLGESDQKQLLIQGKVGTRFKEVGRMQPPIHSEFANCGSSPKDIMRFTKRFGPLWDCTGHYPYDFSFDVSQWTNCQKQFQDWWRYQLGAKPTIPFAPAQTMEQEMRELQKSVTGRALTDHDKQSYLDDIKNILEYREPPPEYEWVPRNDRIPSLVYTRQTKGITVEIVAPNLWSYLTLCLLTEKSDMLRVCQNNNCANPYFVATRKDQKFCNNYCSQLVASRRWWKLHGSDRRKKRNSMRRKKRRR